MKDGVTVLCEDKAQASFARIFLMNRGYRNRQIHTRFTQKAQGSGEAYVRNHFAAELKELRRWGNRGLIVIVDGDGRPPDNRKQQLNVACETARVEVRSGGEPVAVFVPCRNIETWFLYLTGGEWSEDSDGKAEQKCKSEGLAGDAAKRLHRMCFDAQKLAEPTPLSLIDACKEWKRLV